MRTPLAFLFALGSVACTREAPQPPAQPAPPPATALATAPAPVPVPIAPPAPGSLRAPASPEVAASFQQCTGDDQCTIVGNGCCDPGGPEPTVAVRRDQSATFKALFDCNKAVCRTSDLVACKPMPPCTRDDCTLAELAGCAEVEVPVAKCASGRCAVSGG